MLTNCHDEAPPLTSVTEALHGTKKLAIIQEHWQGQDEVDDSWMKAHNLPEELFARIWSIGNLKSHLGIWQRSDYGDQMYQEQFRRLLPNIPVGYDTIYINTGHSSTISQVAGSMGIIVVDLRSEQQKPEWRSKLVQG